MDLKFYCFERHESFNDCQPIVCEVTNVQQSLKQACLEYFQQHKIYGHLRKLKQDNLVLKLVDAEMVTDRPEVPIVQSDEDGDGDATIGYIVCGSLVGILLLAALIRVLYSYFKRNKKGDWNPELANVRKRPEERRFLKIWPISFRMRSCSRASDDGTDEQHRHRRWRRKMYREHDERKKQSFVNLAGKEVPLGTKRLERPTVEADTGNDPENFYVITETCLGSLKEMMTQLVDDSFKTLSQSLDLEHESIDD